MMISSIKCPNISIISLLVKDKGIPVGYVFSTVEDTESSKGSGLYPEWDNLPEKM